MILQAIIYCVVRWRSLLQFVAGKSVKMMEIDRQCRSDMRTWQSNCLWWQLILKTSLNIHTEIYKHTHTSISLDISLIYISVQLFIFEQRKFLFFFLFLRCLGKKLHQRNTLFFSIQSFESMTLSLKFFVFSSIIKHVYRIVSLFKEQISSFCCFHLHCAFEYYANRFKMLFLSICYKDLPVFLSPFQTLFYSISLQ